jgi:hypothetical protein
MSGHASAQQRERIQQLEIRLLDGVASREELLELALLALEPEHDGVRASRLLKQIPVDDPLRNLWLAYVDIYEGMDVPALNEATDLCNEILRSSIDRDIRAAAFMLRAAALSRLSDIPAARGDALESVRLAPEWIGNRQLLAQILRECAEREAAEEELKRALANVYPMARPESYPVYMFERLITARLSGGIGDRIRRQLAANT